MGCTLIRFADDAVLAFEDFFDAKRVLGVLGMRTRGLDIGINAKRQVADAAARAEAKAVIEPLE
jgi:hypothetical protein